MLTERQQNLMNKILAVSKTINEYGLHTDYMIMMGDTIEEHNKNMQAIVEYFAKKIEES